MTNNTNHKVVNTANLITLRDKAIEANYNRTLVECDPQFLDPDGFHILKSVMIHSHAQGEEVDPHHRCTVLVKAIGQDDPVEAFLDVSFEDYDNLLDAEVVRDRLKATN